MRKKRLRIHIGLRTLKTAAAVILAMVVVDAYGTTPSKLIFAMLGAMAAVQPSFKAQPRFWACYMERALVCCFWPCGFRHW